MFMASSKYKFLFVVVFMLLLVIGGAVLFFTLMRGNGIEGENVDRVTLSGTYVCIPPKEDPVPGAQGCVAGLKATDGKYYALDFSLMSSEVPTLTLGESVSASGVVAAAEEVSAEYWQNYLIEGIFSVTGSLTSLKTIELGTFFGTLPCKDCAGILTDLTLRQSPSDAAKGTYTLRETYESVPSRALIYEGEWTQETASGTVYVLRDAKSNEVRKRYERINDYTLRELPLDGSVIEPALSYDLIKEGVVIPQESLRDTSWIWKKTEYQDGKTATPKGADFVLSFSADDHVTSTTDCNTLGGSVVFDGGILSFGPFVATQMYCEGSLEGVYAKDLALANAYAVTGDTLRLDLNRDHGVMVFTRVTAE